MKDISESFGANQRAERKEYRAAKKDAFEKARDRGELKFDATTPLDSSFTSLTAATAANIFAKNKARKAVKRGFDKSYLASKTKQKTSGANTSIPKVDTSTGTTVRGSDSSEANYNKELAEIKSRINPATKTASNPATKTASNPATKTASNPATKTASNPATKTASNKPKSKGMAAAFSPERIAQYKAKGWAMDHTTHKSTSNNKKGGATTPATAPATTPVPTSSQTTAKITKNPSASQKPNKKESTSLFSNKWFQEATGANGNKSSGSNSSKTKTIAGIASFLGNRYGDNF